MSSLNQTGESLSEGHSEGPSEPLASNSLQQFNRACEACRFMKVRCLIDPASSTSQCQRCVKARRRCVFAPVQRKKPRKRTDVRVAELEKEIETMRSLLQKVRSSTISDNPQPNPPPPTTHASSSKSVETTAQIQNSGTTPTVGTILYPSPDPKSSQSPLGHPGLGDVIDRGIISFDTAAKLVRMYTDTLLRFGPFVPIPVNVDIETFRQSKPILFLAVISAAALGGDPKISGLLSEELTRIFADRIVIQGEKSIEIIQSLVLAVLFYMPRDSAVNLNFYQYTQLAATMVVELGLCSAPFGYSGTPEMMETYRIHLHDSYPDSVGPIMEKARTLLTCFILTSGMSSRLRRPNTLPWNNWMTECVELLDKSPELFDNRIAAWAKLQRIVEETVTALGLDDTSTVMTSTDEHVQAIIKTFERRVDDWRKSNQARNFDSLLNIGHYQSGLFLYEFAMEGRNHDIRDFKRSYFTMPAVFDHHFHDRPLQGISTNLAPLQLKAAMKCLHACHAIITEFLSLDPIVLRVVPNLLYVRVAYSLLVRLRFAINVSTGQYDDALVSVDTDLDTHMEEVFTKVSLAAQPEGYRLPAHWLTIITKLRDRYDQLRSHLNKTPLLDNAQGEPENGLDHAQFHPTGNFSHQTNLEQQTSPDMPIFSSANNHSTNIENHNFMGTFEPYSNPSNDLFFQMGDGDASSSTTNTLILPGNFDENLEDPFSNYLSMDFNEWPMKMN